MVVQPPKTLKERVVSKFLHTLILGLLHKYTASDIAELVKYNIDPFETFADMADNFAVKQIASKVTENKDRVDEYLSYENIVVQAQEHRPDLLPVLSTPEAQQWLECNLAKLRTAIYQG